MTVIERNRQRRLNHVVEVAVRHESKAWEHEMGETVEQVAGIGWTVRRIHCAPFRLLDVVTRRAIDQAPTVDRFRIDVVGLHGTDVEESEMGRVDISLERLQPVAVPL